MKIAQLAPLRGSVPYQRHGGTARIVSYVTEEVVHLGHDVTLLRRATLVHRPLIPLSACRPYVPH